MKNYLNQLISMESYNNEGVKAIADIWNLDLNNRKKLYKHWLDKYKLKLKNAIRNTEEQYQISAERMKEIKFDEDRYIMEDASVIGMTTTAAARYKSVLDRIKCPIIIVEEAAEVLEAHIITTLTEACKHLILIGDHKQLRPNPNVYELAEKYHLKYSLFERLIVNNIPFDSLKKQRRMRPEISQFARIIYPHLEDDISVQNFPNIRGLISNVYFIDHTFEEHHDMEYKSHSNMHEADYIVKLCSYLIKQGYEKTSITILTLYSGQIVLLRQLMPKAQCDGVRVSSIDNYQGEENDIILLSLVRSNTECNSGFVKDDHRVCVAITRAKHGFFAIGNFKMLASQSDLLSNIVRLAKLNKPSLLSETLTLRCQNHPNESQILAKTAKDFDKAPEGGCMRKCDFRRDCGHCCDIVCHGYDQLHKTIQCKKPCNKILCDYGHKCNKPCFEKCLKCMQLVDKIIEKCGHTQKVPCSINENKYICKMKCLKVLSCKHRCSNTCGEAHTVKCLQIVKKQLDCGHTADVCCYLTIDQIKCAKPCKSNLKCYHECSGSCSSCFAGSCHSACKSPCKQILICGHNCLQPCTKDCPPCQHVCQNRCIHSKCSQVCGKPCQPCIEPCAWKCEHYACTMLCNEPCNRPKCDAPCKKVLKCKHKCIGLCGEPCPSKCIVCDRDEVLEIFFGTEEINARYVELTDCKHVLEVTSLDKWISEKVSSPEITMILCPKCKVPIQRSFRYGKEINFILQYVDRIKVKTYGEKNKGKYLQLQDILDEMRENKIYRHFENINESANAFELITWSNKLIFVEKFDKHKKSLTKLITKDLFPEILNNLVLKVIKLIIRLYNIKIMFSHQELDDFKKEQLRIEIVIRFLKLFYRIKDKSNLPSGFLAILTDFFFKMVKTINFTGDMEKEAEDFISKMKVFSNGLGITEKERLEIIQSQGLSQGHWFKCPNDHIYAIGECGGPTQESQCPECKEKIGGTSHRLVRGNLLASEMDNATTTAYPTVLQ